MNKQQLNLLQQLSIHWFLSDSCSELVRKEAFSPAHDSEIVFADCCMHWRWHKVHRFTSRATSYKTSVCDRQRQREWMTTRERTSELTCFSHERCSIKDFSHKQSWRRKYGQLHEWGMFSPAGEQLEKCATGMQRWLSEAKFLETENKLQKEALMESPKVFFYCQNKLQCQILLVY